MKFTNILPALLVQAILTAATPKPEAIPAFLDIAPTGAVSMSHPSLIKRGDNFFAIRGGKLCHLWFSFIGNL